MTKQEIEKWREKIKSLKAKELDVIDATSGLIDTTFRDAIRMLCDVCDALLAGLNSKADCEHEWELAAVDAAGRPASGPATVSYAGRCRKCGAWL